MISWTGKGYLGFVVPFAVFSVAHGVAYLAKGDLQKFSAHTNTAIAAIVALILWNIGSKLNKQNAVKISDATQVPEPWYKRRINHTCLMLPLEWWGVVFFAIIASKSLGF